MHFWKKLQAVKLQALKKYPLKFWNNKIWRHASNMQPNLWTKHRREMDESLVAFFPQKGDIGIPKNFRDITLLSMAVKFYQALFLNSKTRKSFEEIRTNFDGIAPQPHKFWQPIELSKELEERYLKQHYCSKISLNHLTPYTEAKWGKCFLHVAFPRNYYCY